MGAPQAVRDAGLDAVIGMYPAVHRLRTTVVAPWTAHLLGDAAVRPPHRVLVHGAEGCGVTFIAERLVDELTSVAGVDAVLIPTLDEMVERDPHELAAILGANEASDAVLIGVSHRPWTIPAELFGDGGFERMAFVSPPDWDARRFRIWESSWGRALPAADLDRLVIATEGWSGPDITSLGELSVASVDELIAAVPTIVPGTVDWLARSREMIRALGSYGRLDDLAGYLQRYRLL